MAVTAVTLGCRRANRANRPIGPIRRALTGSWARNRPEVVGQVVGRGVAVSQPLGQGLEQDRFEVERHPRVEPPGPAGLLVGDLVDQLGGGLAVERRSERDQLVERRPQAIDVGPAVDVAGLGLLGAHVPRSAQEAVDLRLARVGQATGEAEVGDPDHPLGVDQEVRRLDVAVDHPLMMGMPQRLGRLPPDVGDPPVIARTPGRNVRRRLVDRLGPAQETPEAANRSAPPPQVRVMSYRLDQAIEAGSGLAGLPRPDRCEAEPPVVEPGGDRPVASEVAEDAVEPRPFDPLHRVVAEPADLADVEDRDDVRMVQPAAVLASLRNRRRPDESGAAEVPSTFKATGRSSPTWTAS